MSDIAVAHVVECDCEDVGQPQGRCAGLNCALPGCGHPVDYHERWSPPFGMLYLSGGRLGHCLVIGCSCAGIG